MLRRVARSRTTDCFPSFFFASYRSLPHRETKKRTLTITSNIVSAGLLYVQDKKRGSWDRLSLKNVIIPWLCSTFFAHEIYNAVTYRAFRIPRAKTYVISRRKLENALHFRWCEPMGISNWLQPTWRTRWLRWFWWSCSILVNVSRMKKKEKCSFGILEILE